MAGITNMYGNSFKRGTEMSEATIGNPDGEPYVVVIEKRGWIPISIVIWAKDEKDAEERVVNGLTRIHDTHFDAMKNEKRDDYSARNWLYANKILELYRNEGAKVEKLDKRMILKAPWAANDTLI